MSNETEEMRKRLKAVEDAVKELREQDLLIAKLVAFSLCPMGLNIAGRTLKAVDAKSFKEVWDKKLEATKKMLEDTQTVESTFNIISQFDKELATYVRATKVDTADKAMEVAHTFIKKYSPVALPLKAEREDDVWLVDIDVGALAVKIAKVKVDARTGDILSYDIPEKK